MQFNLKCSFSGPPRPVHGGPTIRICFHDLQAIVHVSFWSWNMKLAPGCGSRTNDPTPYACMSSHMCLRISKSSSPASNTTPEFFLSYRSNKERRKDLDRHFPAQNMVLIGWYIDSARPPWSIYMYIKQDWIINNNI